MVAWAEQRMNLRFKVFMFVLMHSKHTLTCKVNNECFCNSKSSVNGVISQPFSLAQLISYFISFVLDYVMMLSTANIVEHQTVSSSVNKCEGWEGDGPGVTCIFQPPQSGPSYFSSTLWLTYYISLLTPWLYGPLRTMTFFNRCPFFSVVSLLLPSLHFQLS
jgi:hypothetical protein